MKLYLDAAIEGEKKLTSVNRDKENSKKELEDVKNNRQIYGLIDNGEIQKVVFM